MSGAVARTRRLVVCAAAGGIISGIMLTVAPYIITNFCAQRFTSARPEEIRCEDTPDAAYCRRAVHDSVALQAAFGSVAAVMSLLFGSLLGALSDAYGRHRMMVACALPAILTWIAFLFFVRYNVSLYIALALLPLAEPPVLPLYFAYVSDLSNGEEDCSIAFGMLMGATALAMLVGVGMAAALSVEACLLVVLVLSILQPLYISVFLQETLPPCHRRPVRWRDAMPVYGLRILVRSPLFARLSLVVVGQSLLGAGLGRLSASYLQEHLYWPKSANGIALGSGCVSVLLWSSLGLSCITHRFGNRPVLRLSLGAGVLSACGLIFATAQWHVYLLNLLVAGAGTLAFPATTGLKSRLVDDNEQGQLQCALNTAKSAAECLGPLLFGALFELCDASAREAQGPAARWALPRGPLLANGLLYLPLLALAAKIPALGEAAGSRGKAGPGAALTTAGFGA